MVFSSFATSSFFSRTLNSCFSTMVVPFLALGCAVISCHLDRLRLVALGARQEQSQDAVAVFGLDAVRVDLDGHCHGPVEATGESLAAMQRRLLRVGDRSFAGQSDGAALHLQVEVGLLHPWKLGDDDEVIAFAKHVERRKGAATAEARVQPTARPIGVQSLLKACESIKRIGEYSHCRSSVARKQNAPDRSRDATGREARSLDGA